MLEDIFIPAFVFTMFQSFFLFFLAETKWREFRLVHQTQHHPVTVTNTQENQLTRGRGFFSLMVVELLVYMTVWILVFGPFGIQNGGSTEGSLNSWFRANRCNQPFQRWTCNHRRHSVRPGPPKPSTLSSRSTKLRAQTVPKGLLETLQF